MAWSPQQEAAIVAVSEWFHHGTEPFFYLAGYAGTGKTTLAKELAGDIGGTVLYGAFTGKAALVLRRKGCGGASTIHSMIYTLDRSSKGWEPKFKLNEEAEVRNAKLVIIDECSMVAEDLAKDLLSFGTKILVLGDPAQLPPVGGAGFFTAREPDFMLTEVHRQAQDNPIIAMSMKIREGGQLDHGDYGTSRVVDRKGIDAQDVLEADQVLVGLNKTRRSYNARIRELKGFTAQRPQVGDRLVCLKNNKDKRLLNGGLWDVTKVDRYADTGISMHVTSEDSIETLPTQIRVKPEFFRGEEDDLSWQDKRGTEEFTFGYALTTHKAQGSQWENVLVFNESAAFRQDDWRWAYTAVTRAADRVTIVQER